MKSTNWARIVLVCVCAMLFSHAVRAQEVSFDEEYDKRLKAYQTISPGGETPFGERINLYTGELSFTQTDLGYEGNGPTIVINRSTLSSQEDRSTDHRLAFGTWELSVPRIETLIGVTGFSTDVGHEWGHSGDNYARCTNFMDVFTMDPAAWHGIEFITEDGARHPMLKRVPEYTAKPTINIGGSNLTFTAVTLDNWQFGCLKTVDNDVGEGFLAVSPDGTRYWLNHLVGKPANTYREQDISGEWIRTFRALAVMYVTKIEDRFGNSISYHYSGDKLTSITATDGRRVDIAWRADAPLVQSITQQDGSSKERTWNYDYQDATTDYPSLKNVTLPDASQWSFSGAFGDYSLPPVYTGSQSCTFRTATNDLTQTPIVATITAPSGVQGRFERKRIHHGRSYVPSDCVDASEDPATSFRYEAIFPIFASNALTKRTISGLGVGVQDWSYAYPANAVGSTTSDQCASEGNCAETSWVDITDPDGNRTRHTFSTRAGAINPVRWMADEGKQITTEWYQGGGGTPLRTKVYHYASYDRGPYPTRIGDSLSFSATNTAKLETWTPLDRTQITQQDVTFTHQVTAFDAFARETAAHDYNTQDHSRYLYTTYHDGLPNWVLGQIATSKVQSTAVSQTDYDANDMPWKTYAYGKLQQTLTYDTTSSVASGQRGMLKTVTDGNSHTTTLSNWKRGIPQTIHFPPTPEASGGATIQAQVDDLGQIDWTEDPDDYRTCYTFDEMGRLASLTYPSETQTNTCDISKWSKLIRTFAPVSATEHGLGDGHWKLTETIGANKKVTYFDGLWRPVVTEAYDANVLKQAAVTRYDTFGRTVFQSYPKSYVGTFAGIYTGTSTTYDALGRVKETVQNWEGEGDGLPPLTTTTSYLPGFQTRVVNPRLKATTTTAYQAWDQPSVERPLEISHPTGAYTSIVRDVFGAPTAITRHNSDGSRSVTRQLIYNAAHELCKRIEPETGVSVMTYDAAGNLNWTASAQNGLNNSNCTDTGSVPVVDRVTRIYDARNRVQELVFADTNGSQSWHYTADGLPDSVDTTNEDGNVTVTNTYAYNHRRLLSGETQIQPGIGSVSLGYAYNGNGVLSSITYPGGRMVGYAPNGLGQPTQASSYATGVGYYPNGAMSGFTYGNGIVHSMTQNARQLPEQSIDSGGVLNDSYDYDANGNVLAISDGLAGAHGNRDMTYDDLDRLLTTSSPMFNGTMTYSYDVLDNLIHVVAPTRNWYYCYDASWRLTNLKTGSCTGSTVVGLGYDAQGNLSNKNGQQYVFDLGNRLREATGKEAYRYDASGRRVASIAQSGAPAVGTIYSYYGHDGVLRYQRDERQGKATDYITLNGSLVAAISMPIAPTSVGLWVDGTSNTGDYTVNWTAAGSAASYTLQEQVGSGSWSTIQSSSATSKDITAKPNGTYHYRSQACNATGCSAWSNTGTIVVTLPPSQVPVISAPDSSTGSYTVSWGISATAESYTLQERIDGGSWATVYTGSSLSQPYAGKAVAYYDYKVRACNLGGCSAYSAVKTVQVLLPPAGTPVISVPATSYTGSYTVSWTTAPTADSYDLQEYAGGAWTTIQSGSATSRAISGQGNGTYTYRARGCNASGCGSWGNEANIAVTLPPSQVPTLTVPATSYTGSYTATWTSSATATSYTLQEYASGSWSTSYSGVSLSKAYSGKGAGTYSYRVQACNAGGCSPWSTIDNITVTLPPASAPTLTVPTDSSTGSYTVSWTSVSTATSYKLDEQVGSGSWSQIQDAAATSKALSGKADGSYSYRVRACNAAGCSGYSPADMIAVLAPPTGTSVVTTPTDNYTGSYSVTWTAVTKATSYYLQRKIGSGSWATVYNGEARTWSASGQPAETYSYRAEACNSAGCASWSAVASTVVHGPPAMPATLTGSSDVEYEFRPPIKNFYLDWSATADTDHYELEQSINGTASIVYSGTATSWGTSGINNSREYRVRACNAAGCSAWKGPLSL